MIRLLACVLVLSVPQAAGYRAEVEAFRKGREERINSVTGATALVGLHWLATGEHTIGSAASNAIVLSASSAPAKLGTLAVRADGATLRVAPGVMARVNDRVSGTIELDPSKDVSVTIDGMTFTLIKRGARLALRVWDRDAPARLAFRGLTWYPPDAAWSIDAAFVSHTPARFVRVLNVLGETVNMLNPGAAVFQVGNREYRLEALVDEDNPDALFFPFKDATSNKTTYGSGRYFYIGRPVNGRVKLDFNYALNPPCAFSAFTTCPVPPASNRLTLAITAGELYRR